MAEHYYESNAYVKSLINGLYPIDQNIQRLDIIVSFLKTSGYELLEPLLESVIEENIPVRVLTSTYMNITDPIALRLMQRLLGEENIRLYNGDAPSFHPKAYFLYDQKEENSKIYIGSSNISRPALTDGIEWNYCIHKKGDPKAFEKFEKEFNYLFESEAIPLTKEIIDDYRRNYKLPSEDRLNLNSHFNKYRRSKNSDLLEVVSDCENDYDNNIESLYKPNHSQLEALVELEETRENGNDKGIVVVATGCR